MTAHRAWHAAATLVLAHHDADRAALRRALARPVPAAVVLALCEIATAALAADGRDPRPLLAALAHPDDPDADQDDETEDDR